ncbi:sn-1-specific diacylglycerol lipase ABHD11 isoform X1 [Chlorocebus sabaeus]|uniref:sn-1-specific diacylglycerol lipase ABHD11 isoform X1 n=1 Tax=Chlorocebus sabaeus TaxID=60711 RepID=UPI0018B0CAD8|nr:protein ABHD11 isoform X1 [Chlorocebus sabaeus]
MLRCTRAWRLPLEGLGLHSRSFARVPVAPSSSGGRGEAEPRPLPLSYSLLDGEAALPAVIFLHGLFGCKTNFNSIAKAFSQQTGRRVLTVDARNHGNSPHSPDMSYEIMSQDLQDLLPQLGLVPCVVVGHSMGGRTAMLLALQRPELVERLIAVDISPVEGTGSSHFPAYVAAMRTVNIPDGLPRSRARKLADEQLSSVVQVIHPSPPDAVVDRDLSRDEWYPQSAQGTPPTAAPPQNLAVRQYLLTNLVEVDGRLAWRLNLDALAQHLDKLLTFPQRQESYLGPTLFLLGGNSQFVHPSHHPEIMRLFPRAQIQTVPNAGHWIHAERPQDFIDAIRGFLV